MEFDSVILLHTTYLKNFFISSLRPCNIVFEKVTGRAQQVHRYGRNNQSDVATSSNTTDFDPAETRNNGALKSFPYSNVSFLRPAPKRQ